MNAGYIRLGAETHRWLLTSSGLVLGRHTFVCEQVGLRTWRVSRVVAGKLDSHIVTLPHPAAPPPVLPLPKGRRAKWAQKVA